MLCRLSPLLDFLDIKTKIYGTRQLVPPIGCNFVLLLLVCCKFCIVIVSNFLLVGMDE
jgi:hypothetical protein